MPVSRLRRHSAIDSGAATSAIPRVPAHSSPVLLSPRRLVSSPFETPQQPEVAISMRTNRPLLQYRNPFLTLSEGVPFMNPTHHTRVPHAFAPTTHRYTPYTRVVASAPPISLTVREPKVPRNERGVVSATTCLGIISAASLLSFVESHPITPVMFKPSAQSRSSCIQTDHEASAPALGAPAQDQDEDIKTRSDHLASKKDDKKSNSEVE